MSSSRRLANDILRFLEAVAQPLCFVDDDHQIVFVNAACAQWLGVAQEELLGKTVAWQSADADPIAAAANALCPPPQVFMGEKAVAQLIRPAAGSSQERHAQFIPLAAESGAPRGVLVLLEPNDSPAGLSNSAESGRAGLREPEAESQLLHESVQRLRREMNAWHHLNRLAGNSAAMVRVRSQVKMAAASTAAVLIVGPAGIGKQHLARSIHAASPAAGAAFTILACEALNAELVNTTISSVANRQRAALNSPLVTPLPTLLLQNVDQLPAEFQLALAERMSVELRNARVLATAAESLDKLVRSGQFRADLALALTTLVIELPPLAKRPEDIPLLAQMFLEDLNAQGSKQLRGFTPEAHDRLAQYDWPGQTDELAAVVREAAMQAANIDVAPADLPRKLWHAGQAVKHSKKPAEAINLEVFLNDIEKQLIERAFQLAKGNKSRAARLLGQTRPRLYRRMERLGLATGEHENEKEA